MNRPLAVLGIALGALLCSACKANRTIDVMTLPAVCDSVPQPLFVGETRGGRIPSITLRSNELATVVGYVVEAGTERPLRAGLTLYRGDAAKAGQAVGRELPTDVSGGFLLDSVPAGGHRLRVRSFNHRFRDQPLELVAGQIDTVIFCLPYYICVGY